MRTENIYENLITGLLSDLLRASQIQICIRFGSDLNMFTSSPNPELVSVNGFDSTTDFTQHLEKLGDKLVAGIRSAQADFTASDRYDFVRALILNFNPMLKIVRHSRMVTADLTRADDEVPQSFLFIEPMIINEGNGLVPDSVIPYIIDGARPFATAWRNSMLAIKNKLNILSVIVAFTHHTNNTSVPAASTCNNKIIIRGNAARLAVMIRILYECHVFETPNKEELCRGVCRCIATINKGDLSNKTFRNNFDIPDPDALAYMIEELTRMLEIARKLEERYN